MTRIVRFHGNRCAVFILADNGEVQIQWGQKKNWINRLELSGQISWWASTGTIYYASLRKAADDFCYEGIPVPTREEFAWAQLGLESQ